MASAEKEGDKAEAVQPSEGLRERRRRENKERIAGVALQLFEERGYVATTIDDIAEQAGISQRTFFRYFDTKEDVIFGDQAEICANLETIDLPSGDPRAILAVLEAHSETTLRTMVGLSDAKKFRQLRRLTAREPALKLLAATRDQEIFEGLHDRVSAALGPEKQMLARLIIGVASIQTGSALDTFATAHECEDLEHIVGLYEQSKTALRDLLKALPE